MTATDWPHAHPLLFVLAAIAAVPVAWAWVAAFWMLGLRFVADDDEPIRSETDRLIEGMDRASHTDPAP